MVAILIGMWGWPKKSNARSAFGRNWRWRERDSVKGRDKGSEIVKDGEREGEEDWEIMREGKREIVREEEWEIEMDMGGVSFLILKTCGCYN